MGISIADKYAYWYLKMFYLKKIVLVGSLSLSEGDFNICMTASYRTINSFCKAPEVTCTYIYLTLLKKYVYTRFNI